jgi:chromosome segregation ATPase
LLSVRLLKGTLIATRKYVRMTEYTVKNSGRQAKTVLVEYPIEPTWTLVSPKNPAEKTRDLYRFRVEATSRKPVKLQIDEQRTDSQAVALTNIDDGTIQIYLSAKVVSPRVKTALGEVVKRKHAVEQVAAELQQRQQRIRDIGEDQARIRQNMAQLDRNTDVYKSYVKKFSEQEAEIEKVRGQIAGLTERVAELRKSLDEYLLGLDLQ